MSGHPKYGSHPQTRRPTEILLSCPDRAFADGAGCLFLAPALRHRQNEGDMGAVLRYLDSMKAGFIAEHAIPHHWRALLPIISAGHAGFSDWDDDVFRHRRPRLADRAPAPAAQLLCRVSFGF